MIRAALAAAAACATGATAAAPAPPPAPIPVVQDQGHTKQLQRRPIPTPAEGACLRALRSAGQTPAFAWAPTYWSLTCRERAGDRGWTVWPTRLIVINADQPTVEQVAAFAHELGHAEMFEWPQWKRDALEQSTGRKLWDYWAPDGRLVWDLYVTDPGELWAQGRMHATTGLSLDGRPFYTPATLEEWSSWVR